MPKRHKRETSEERILRKINKYEKKLQIRQRRPLLTPPIQIQVEDVGQDDVSSMEDGTPVVLGNEECKELEVTDEQLDEDIINLLGDAPDENKYGQPIHKELALRWANIIKNGLSKEKKIEIKKKYLIPENCKTIDAPKLNLEAQAAVSDMAVKRDKAIANKQSQIASAITALAMAFNKLSKSKDNLELINYISDAARLLCDHQHQESSTRRNFILQGLEQSTRDSIKDTEVDQWLFGESFSDKLKATKAIKKSGQEISVIRPRKVVQQPQRRSLNFKGPVVNTPGNTSRNLRYVAGPQRNYHSYKRPRAQISVPQKNQSQSKFPLRSNNNQN